MAPELIAGRESSIITIVLCPHGIARSIIPDNLPAWKAVYGLDLLRVRLHGLACAWACTAPPVENGLLLPAC